MEYPFSPVLAPWPSMNAAPASLEAVAGSGLLLRYTPANVSRAKRAVSVRVNDKRVRLSEVKRVSSLVAAGSLRAAAALTRLDGARKISIPVGVSSDAVLLPALFVRDFLDALSQAWTLGSIPDDAPLRDGTGESGRLTVSAHPTVPRQVEVVLSGVGTTVTPLYQCGQAAAARLDHAEGAHSYVVSVDGGRSWRLEHPPGGTAPTRLAAISVHSTREWQLLKARHSPRRTAPFTLRIHRNVLELRTRQTERTCCVMAKEFSRGLPLRVRLSNGTEATLRYDVKQEHFSPEDLFAYAMNGDQALDIEVLDVDLPSVDAMQACWAAYEYAHSNTGITDASNTSSGNPNCLLTLMDFAALLAARVDARTLLAWDTLHTESGALRFTGAAETLTTRVFGSPAAQDAGAWAYERVIRAGTPGPVIPSPQLVHADPDSRLGKLARLAARSRDAREILLLATGLDAVDVTPSGAVLLDLGAVDVRVA